MLSVPLSLAFFGQVCLIANQSEWASRSVSIFSESLAELTYCEAATVPDDYTYYEGVGAYKIHTEALNWNDARLACQDEGAHLVIINSQEEADIVAELVDNSDEVTNYNPVNNYTWIGFHSYFEDYDFVALDGTPVADSGYNVWAEGEPNNEAEREKCGSILNYEAKLNDATCADRYAYVCEFDDPYVNWS